MLNDRSSPLSLLRTRRSGKPRDIVAPGPESDQVREMIAIASRTPDHGKLAPWRFVTVPAEKRDAFAALLKEALRIERPGAGERDIETAANDFAYQAPALVVVLSASVPNHKIPLWEQELSAGAACMNLLHAAHAMDFVGGWITGWPAYSARVRDAFGADGERIAGFIFIGTPRFELEERPRPEMEAIASEWVPHN